MRLILTTTSVPIINEVVAIYAYPLASAKFPSFLVQWYPLLLLLDLLLLEYKNHD